MAFDSKRDFTPPKSFWSLFFAFDMGYLILVRSNILLSMVVQEDLKSQAGRLQAATGASQRLID